MKWMIFACAIAVSGCQSLDSAEVTWQSLHMIDFAQTYNAIDDPCYVETNFFTQRLIGEHPTETQVMAWGIGTAVTHWFVAEMLDYYDAPIWLGLAWDLGTIGQTGYTVAQNRDAGVRMWGENETFEGCTR